MKLTQAIKMALSSVMSNKMRSFLTMLGIIIGVMAVTLLISIVQGATKSITDQLGSLGGTNLICYISKESPKLSLEDVMNLEKEESIGSVAAYVNNKATATAAGKQYDADITGITSKYLDMKSNKVEQGRGILDIDNEYRLNVCVVGTEVANQLFGQTNVIDETIRISGKDYRIVGVMEETGANAMSTTDSYIYIPFTNAQRLFSSTGVTTFDATATSNDQVESAEKKLNSYLKGIYGEDNYQVINMGSIIDMIKQIYDTMSYLLGGIAGISLLVSGIGIMNIMLVSVTERTKEIGIRKAIGAQKSDIIIQFLIESVVLSLMGGMIGMLLSVGILGIVNLFMTSVHFTITLSVAVIAMLFSVGVGVIFGIYPANKATKLKPIDALRFE